MSKPTPRPWTVEDVMGDGPIDICGPDIPGRGSPNLIATALADLGVGGDVLRENSEAIANARFIVQACNYHEELLEALKTAFSGFIEIHAHGIGCPKCPSVSEDPLDCPAVRYIEAAIAKAEGR